MPQIAAFFVKTDYFSMWFVAWLGIKKVTKYERILAIPACRQVL